MCRLEGGTLIGGGSSGCKAITHCTTTPRRSEARTEQIRLFVVGGLWAQAFSTFFPGAVQIDGPKSAHLITRAIDPPDSPRNLTKSAHQITRRLPPAHDPGALIERSASWIWNSHATTSSSPPTAACWPSCCGWKVRSSYGRGLTCGVFLTVFRRKNFCPERRDAIGYVKRAAPGRQRSLLLAGPRAEVAAFRVGRPALRQPRPAFEREEELDLARRRFTEAMNSLSARDREMFLGFYVRGISVAGLALSFGLAKQTVRVALSRAKKAILGAPESPNDHQQRDEESRGLRSRCRLHLPGRMRPALGGAGRVSGQNRKVEAADTPDGSIHASSALITSAFSTPVSFWLSPW